MAVDHRTGTVRVSTPLLTEPRSADASHLAAPANHDHVRLCGQSRTGWYDCADANLGVILRGRRGPMVLAMPPRCPRGSSRLGELVFEDLGG